MNLRIGEFYNIVHENGMLIYQAHPFRKEYAICTEIFKVGKIGGHFHDFK